MGMPAHERAETLFCKNKKNSIAITVWIRTVEGLDLPFLQSAEMHIRLCLDRLNLRNHSPIIHLRHSQENFKGVEMYPLHFKGVILIFFVLRRPGFIHVDFSIQVCYNKGNGCGHIYAAHNGRFSVGFFVSFELQRINNYAVVYHKGSLYFRHEAVF